MTFLSWDDVWDAFNAEVVQLGDKALSLRAILIFAIVTATLFIVTGRIKKWLVGTVLTRTTLDLSARQAIGTVFQYLALLLGFLIILQTAGIDLTTLNVVAGALGIGVGFGLQNIASNFISGLIILFERPVKLGDRIEVGDVSGNVIEIRARATTVLTNDNIAILIPNSKFITENVVNWSYTDRVVRFHVPVGVAYGSDPRQVEKVLMEVAAANPNVLKDPPPEIRFLAFGDSALAFELRVWCETLIHKRDLLISMLNFAIFEAFRENHIAIPYPQRDLHVIGGVDVRMEPHVPPPAESE
jgi:small-conductance mechanosensitive channel